MALGLLNSGNEGLIISFINSEDLSQVCVTVLQFWPLWNTILALKIEVE